jgi:prolyl oligopeptidase
MGCSLAFAGVRGGDELGQEWYRASLHGRTIVSMRDTVASAEYLQSLGVPSSRIALEGGSNGGLVTAGAIALSPSSFACAVITNPVIDVTSCGDRYEAEYGHPIRHKARIKEYAPLELLQPASYPAVLVKVHANDDRVPPSNGYRFVAKLQAVQEGDAPILLRVYQGAGHSGWVSGSTAGEDAYLFFAKHLGLRVR